MREFILLASKGRTTGDFTVDRLADAGRMDLVCRIIANALCISNGIRRDTSVHISLNGPKEPPKLLSLYGEKVEGLLPDERTIGQIIITSLKRSCNLKLGESKEVFPGIIASKKSFESFIKEKSETNQLIYLDRKGEDIRKKEFEDNTLFILGDYAGLPKNTEKLLKNLNAEIISLGKVEVLASQCITIINNELDRKL